MYPRHSVARLLSVAVVASSIAVNLSVGSSKQFNAGTQSATEYFVKQQVEGCVTNQLGKIIKDEKILNNPVFNASDVTSVLVRVGAEVVRKEGKDLDTRDIFKDAAYIIARDKIVQASVYALGKVGHEAGDKTKATLQVLTTVFVLPFIRGQISNQTTIASL
ncbi:hypothetical protein HRU45_00945 [Candidatus Dependentiae bacterium]|nr:hypothetical protein [Candidatus Dependentiae bacterium]